MRTSARYVKRTMSTRAERGRTFQTFQMSNKIA